MTGIDEVAQRAGVSPATVSRALSGRGHVSPQTRERVQIAAEELGYVVSASASGLASGRTRNIGVVVPFLSRWYFSSVVEGAEDALMKRGYDLTLYNLSGGAESRRIVFEQFLLRQRVDAVIAVALELTDDEVSRLLAIRKPIVGIGGPIPGVRTLARDDVAVARLATQHLISLGHTRIAHVGGHQDYDQDFHLGSTRRRGFEQAMKEARLPVTDDLYVPADFTLTGGYAAGKQILGRAYGRPTAIMAATDEMAIGCILAARDLGLSVPHDISVVGIDDHEMAAFFGLTTVAQFPRQQGEAAVELLLDEFLPDTGEPADNIEGLSMDLPFELVVRATTARPQS